MPSSKPIESKPARTSWGLKRQINHFSKAADFHQRIADYLSEQKSGIVHNAANWGDTQISLDFPAIDNETPRGLLRELRTGWHDLDSSEKIMLSLLLPFYLPSRYAVRAIKLVARNPEEHARKIGDSIAFSKLSAEERERLITDVISQHRETSKHYSTISEDLNSRLVKKAGNIAPETDEERLRGRLLRTRPVVQRGSSEATVFFDRINAQMEEMILEGPALKRKLADALQSQTTDIVRGRQISLPTDLRAISQLDLARLTGVEEESVRGRLLTVLIRDLRKTANAEEAAIEELRLRINKT